LSSLFACAPEFSAAALAATKGVESLSAMDASWLCLQALFEPERAKWASRAQSGSPAARLAGVLAAATRSLSPARVVAEAASLGLVSAGDIAEALLAKSGERCVFDEAFEASESRREGVKKDEWKVASEKKVSDVQVVLLVLAAVGEIGSHPRARSFCLHHVPYGEIGICEALFLGGGYPEAKALVGQGFEASRCMSPSFIAESIANLYADQRLERLGLSMERAWPAKPEMEAIGESQRAFESLLLEQAARVEELNVAIWAQEVLEQARLKCPGAMADHSFKAWLAAFASRIEASLLGCVSKSAEGTAGSRVATTKKRL
jgi:hypothetical protein